MDRLPSVHAPKARSVLSSIGILLAGIVTLSLAGALLVHLGFDATAQNPTALVLTLIIQGAAFGLTVLGYAWVCDKQDLLRARLPTRSDVRWTLGGTLAILLLGGGGSFVFWLSGTSMGTNLLQDVGTEHPRLFLYLVPLSFLVIGPGEELLFRGGVQGRLEQAFSTRTAIVLASTPFALAHIGSVSGTGVEVSAYLLLTFALSLVLGYAYAETDNLVVPALIHGAYNATLFFLLYLHVTGLLSPLI